MSGLCAEISDSRWWAYTKDSTKAVAVLRTEFVVAVPEHFTAIVNMADPTPPHTHQDDESSSSESGNELREDSEGWEDLEADVETLEFKDFFSDNVFPTAAAMLENCKKTHGLDFVKIQKDLGVYVSIQYV